jgi:hypothetical protein
MTPPEPRPCMTGLMSFGNYPRALVHSVYLPCSDYGHAARNFKFVCAFIRRLAYMFVLRLSAPPLAYDIGCHTFRGIQRPPAARIAMRFRI